MNAPAFTIFAALVCTSGFAHAGARTMGVILVDLGSGSDAPLREKLVVDLLAQGCWARDECGDGIGLRDDLPKGLTKDDLRKAAGGDEAARKKTEKIANGEAGDHWKHPAGYFWDFDGFLVYSLDAARKTFRITTLDEQARVIGTSEGDATAALTRKWERRSVLKRALKPLWKRFSP